MELQAIRDDLCAARLALGREHPLSERIHRVERSLTPGDALWCDDAASAERELLTISTEIGQLPPVALPSDRSRAGQSSEMSATGLSPGVNEAIKRIADAIELL